jgi:hypothetical protein
MRVQLLLLNLACSICLALPLLLPMKGHAQSGTAAQGSALELECQGCQPARKVVRCLVGKKIQLIGPPGTAPIKGKLVAVGDTLTLSRLDAPTQMRKVAFTDVKVVAIPRPLLWLKILVLHIGYFPYFLVAGILLAFSGASLLLFVAILGLPYALILTILIATAFKTYPIGPWQRVKS